MALNTMSRLRPNAEKPLAWHLVWLCLALSMPIVVIAAMLSWFYAQAQRSSIEQSALNAAHEIMAATDRELADLIATTKVLALSRALQRGDLDAFDTQARDVYRQIGINVVLRDLQSRQLVNTRVPKGSPLPTNVEADSDRKVRETKKPFVSNLFIGAVTHKPLFIVNVPVLRGGELIYFLNLSLEPEAVREVILQVNLPENWTAAITDRNGFVVAHSTRQEEMLNQQLPISISRGSTNREGVVQAESSDSDHERALIAFTRSQFSDWVAVVAVPRNQIIAPLHHSMIILIGVGAAIVAFSLGLAVIFARRIKEPVGALAAQAMRLSKGQLERPLATRVREVNELSELLMEAEKERQAADAALRASEARLQLAQTAGRIGTWEWDIQEAKAVCSESYRSLYGLDPNGPGHKNPQEWLAQVHPDDQDRVMKEWQRALQSGRLETEYRIVRPDGSVRWIVDRGMPTFDADKRPTRFIGINVDVTERKESEQRLRELQLELLHASRLSAMGQMAAALAHELNQPLGAATNFMSAARIALRTNTRF